MKKKFSLSAALSAPWAAALREGLLSWRSGALLLSLLLPMAGAATLKTGLTLGLAATITLLLCNTLFSLVRSHFPDRLLQPCYFCAAVGVVTILDLLVQAFLPAISAALGIYLPLLSVNVLLLSGGLDRARADSPLHACLGGFATGLGLTVLLCVTAAVRELLGSGTLWGISVLGSPFPKLLFLRAAPGALFLLAVLLAAAQWRAARREGRTND